MKVEKLLIEKAVIDSFFARGPANTVPENKIELSYFCASVMDILKL